MQRFIRSATRLFVPLVLGTLLWSCGTTDSVSPKRSLSVVHPLTVTYPVVTYTGTRAELAVGDSELVHALIQMAADSAVRPCTNCYFASTSENIVHVAATTGWGTGTIGHIHGAAVGRQSFYSDTVGNSAAAGSYQVVVVNSFTPNLPSGTTTVINTGAITTTPSQVNGGTWSSGGPVPWSLENFGPTMTDANGLGAANVTTVSDGTGIRILFNTNLVGGGSPSVIGGGWSTTGTGFLYVAYYVRISSAFSMSLANQIKLFEPRTGNVDTNGNNSENHIISFYPAQGATDGTEMWPQFDTQFDTASAPDHAGIADVPAAPQGFGGPASDYAFTGANLGGSNRGTWHLVEHYIQPESPAGNNNGQHTIWVDGTLAWTSVGSAKGTGGVPTGGIGYFKTGETEHWNYLLNEPTFGGDVPTDHPPTDEWIDIDRIFVAVK